MNKKLIIAALAIMVSASFNTAGAADKKKKSTKTTAAPTELKLTTTSDSLGYAAGMTLTEGLLPFLKSQYGIETDRLDEVERGFMDVMAQGADPKTKAYAAGQQVAFMVLERMLPKLKEDFAGSKDTINTAAFTRGFVNALKKDNSIMADSTAQKYFEANRKQAKETRDAALRKAGEDFLAANAKKPGVITTPSGLQYKVLTKGTGEVPSAEDEVTVKYEGRLIDGTVFDSSYKRPGETTKFHPSQVIKGWTEALTMMPVGSKWELYIPYNLAYGERDMGEIKPFSALVFTVEMVGIEKKQPAADAVKPATEAQKAPAKASKSKKKK